MHEFLGGLEIGLRYQRPICRRAGILGLKVLKGDQEETVIGADCARMRVFVDRIRSGNVTLHPQFSGVHEAPLTGIAGGWRLHVFVDACAVEVFVNNGERVITDLVYPSPDSRGVEFSGPRSGGKIRSLKVWRLKSSWK